MLDLLWHPSRADVIAVTLSDGAVALCQSSGADGSGLWSEGRTCTVTTTECASHSLEPWTLAFGPPGAAGLLFSGGDDAVLQALRLSSSIDGIPSGCSKDDDNNDEDNEDDEQTLATQLWTDRKVHQAGVTSILPLASELLVTGSYDDRIRLLYAPALGRRRVLAELDLGGGVWRLKMLGGDKGYVIFFSFLSAFFPSLLFRFNWSWFCFPSLPHVVPSSDAVRRVWHSSLRHGDVT